MHAAQEFRVAAIFDLEQFDQLPLWGQVLIASRMVRRAALAMTANGPANIHTAVINACDAIDRCVVRGDGVTSESPVFEKARQLRGARDARSLTEAIWWATDAAAAASAANDFPIDATVTNSARNAIASIAEDPRVTPLQLRVLMAGDLDLVRFACGEARIGTYDGTTRHVLDRLAPVHPITLIEPARSARDRAR